MSLSHSVTTGSLWLHHTHTADNATAGSNDQPITLIDNTIPPPDPIASQNDLIAESAQAVPGSGESSFSRKPTASGLREELARRRHSKKQGIKDIYNEPQDIPNQDEAREGRTEAHGGHRQRFRDKMHLRNKKAKKAKAQGEIATDVLIENQRGLFIFGMPLYSSNSLLNFDPPTWQTGDLKESAVNINNAQVPDPSWMWTMKTWYVDMSGDVDEQGWEYSFSFEQTLKPLVKSSFAWHGNHPWFHSFVRRRKWIRRRVKIHSRINKEKTSGSHLLNADYFTIHTNRDRSRGSSADRSLNNRSSFGGRYAESEGEDEVKEISDILALTRTFRNTTLDRKKLEAVKSFLDYGGDDLHYLSQYMPDLMGMFFYQTSRQQLLVDLQATLETLKGTRKEETTPEIMEDESNRRKFDDVQAAVIAAFEQVKDSEYRSNRRKAEKIESSEFKENTHKLDGASSINSSLQKPETEAEDFHSVMTENEIKGIPEEAAIDVEPRIQFEKEDSEETASEKGKADASKEKGKEKA
ncbi:MAG: hypothetical protein MMC33_001653 [Icmadophila ericetorum]|nr:hypothetical protein [Icmadophila ericetorum]